ncbi:MAG: mechanosensitive ion channel [Candidatus Latescibacteria bacterium]|nr:mechanosensitive ion channel [bacterium]MBD3424157.1 mechanosensitive ion channel [Candidatus Latescibacterota bacterium]
MLEDFMNRTFLGNTIFNYLVSAALFLAAVGILYIVRAFIIKKARLLAGKTTTTVDDFLIDTISRRLIPLMYVIAFYLSIGRLSFGKTLSRWITGIFIVLVSVFIVRFLVSVIEYLLDLMWEKKEKESSGQGVPRAIVTFVKIILYTVALLIVFDNMGVQITALITGLGIGGVAIALAAQAILGDLFSYFTIFFDRPFEVGDFIKVGEFRGTVEHIGIKTSRVRSLSGEELVFSNTDLTNSRLQNYGKMMDRRVIFQIGVTYDTPLEKLQNIQSIVKDIIDRTDKAEYERVHFHSFGDFSLNYEIVYLVLSNDYLHYMNVRHSVNMELVERFRDEGIEFAFPTQTIELQGGPAAGN